MKKNKLNNIALLSLIALWGQTMLLFFFNVSSIVRTSLDAYIYGNLAIFSIMAITFYIALFSLILQKFNFNKEYALKKKNVIYFSSAMGILSVIIVLRFLYLWLIY